MGSDQSNEEVAQPAAELQRRAISGSLWTAIHTFVSLPVAFVANAVVARSLGVTNYGDLAFLTAILGLAYGIANFGFSGALIQAGSRAEASGKRDKADDLLRRSLGFHSTVEMPILIVVALVITRHDPAWEVIALGGSVVFSCLLGGASLSITIENRTGAAAKLAMLVNLAIQGASVAAAVSTKSASAVWVVRTLIPAAAIALNFLLLDGGRRRTVLRPLLPFRLGRTFWRFALLGWASGLIGLLVYSRSEIFILELFHKKGALGLFALAFGLSQLITAPADAMLHALMPAVAGVLSSFPERSLRAFERSTRVSALLCGGIAAAVIPMLVFAIPLIYGSSFTSTAWLFLPMALVSTFQSVNNPVTAFVNARQRGGLLLRSVAVSLVVDVVIAVALIPQLGAWGAVIANVAGQMVGLVWLAVTEPLVLGQGFATYARLCRAFLIGTGIGGTALGIGLALRSTSPSLAAVAAGATGTTFYVLAVRLSGSGLTNDDHNVLVGAMAGRSRRYLSQLLRPITTEGAI